MFQRFFFSVKEVNAEQLQMEYEKMVEGLREAQRKRESDLILANPGKNF